MPKEIERTEDMAQPQQPPDPVQTLYTMAGMQALTLGFLIGSQIVVTRQLRRIVLTPPQVKEVVVIYKEVREEIGA